MPTPVRENDQDFHYFLFLTTVPRRQRLLFPLGDEATGGGHYAYGTGAAPVLVAFVQSHCGPKPDRGHVHTRAPRCGRGVRPAPGGTRKRTRENIIIVGRFAVRVSAQNRDPPGKCPDPPHGSHRGVGQIGGTMLGGIEYYYYSTISSPG